MMKHKTLHHKIKSYALIMELTTQSMKNIKILQEKWKTYAPLMEVTTKSMKKQRTRTNYPIQSSQAIIKRNIHVFFGHGMISKLQKKCSTP